MALQNRRAKEGTGQYQDDPLVPLTLGACILASFAIYLGRRHRRSLGRAVAGWRLPGIAALAAPSSRKPATLGTSISKERQAAAAALRAALSRADVPMPELEAALEAAEATDVEGPLVRRGRQQLSLRRRRERDAAEAVRGPPQPLLKPAMRSLSCFQCFSTRPPQRIGAVLGKTSFLSFHPTLV